MMVSVLPRATMLQMPLLLSSLVLLCAYTGMFQFLANNTPASSSAGTQFLPQLDQSDSEAEISLYGITNSGAPTGESRHYLLTRFAVFVLAAAYCFLHMLLIHAAQLDWFRYFFSSRSLELLGLPLLLPLGMFLDPQVVRLRSFPKV